MANSTASTTIARADTASASIIVTRRFQRSTSVPTNGPSTTCGTSPNSEAIASTVPEPLVLVSHQISANCTSWLPSSDSACPPQMVKNFGAQVLACVFVA